MASSSTDWLELNGVRFFTRTFKPADGQVFAAVLFVHGFAEHVVRYDHVFDAWAKQGVAVYAYDQRGFGQTGRAQRGGKVNGAMVSSWPEQLGDISSFVLHVSGEVDNFATAAAARPPLFLVGHSMGGALVLKFATSQPPLPGLDKLKGVVASSPLLRQSKGVRANWLTVKAGSLVGKLSGSLTMKAPLNPEHISRDVEVQRAYASDPFCDSVASLRLLGDMLLGGISLVESGYATWPNKLPLLVIHGSGDKVTEYESSEGFAQKIKTKGADATFYGYEGFYHEMHNEPGDDKWRVINDVSTWIKSKL